MIINPKMFLKRKSLLSCWCTGVDPLNWRFRLSDLEGILIARRYWRKAFTVAENAKGLQAEEPPSSALLWWFRKRGEYFFRACGFSCFDLVGPGGANAAFSSI